MTKAAIVMGRVLFAACAFMAAVCGANERQLRDELRSSAARLLAEEDYAQLEAMAVRFARDKERTPAGAWKLDLLHLGLVPVSDYASTDERFWSERQQRFGRWLERYPASVAARVAMGQVQVGRAWYVRGTRPAKDTPPENWAPFRKQAAAARAYMDSIKAHANGYPEWYRVMVDLALAQGWKREEAQVLVDEAVERHPDYHPFYIRMLEYFNPRWFGSVEARDAFVTYVADRTQRTQGQMLYARLYWTLANEYRADGVFHQTKIDWKRMRTGLEEVAARYPDPWTVNSFARFACLAQDFHTAARLLGRMGPPVPEIWGNGAIFDWCLKYIDPAIAAKAAAARGGR